MKKMISRSCARRTAAALAAAIAVSLAPAGWCAAAPASSYTAAANQRVYHQLDFSDEQERKFAEKGLIEAPQALEIKDANGRVVWSQAAYDFLKNKAPDTANPSLWRNAQNNHVCGLFEVMDGIYQVRGYDMSNITFVRGDTGWIVFDPLMTVECSQAAKALVEKHFGKRPVKAVIYSHSHVDHYGGVRGVVSEADKVPIIAPEGFEEHAVSENVYAGAAMGRRASYQYGTLLDPGPEGRLSIGIGMGQSVGQISYLSPTVNIKRTGEKLKIDGVEMEFQLTPGTEAPAEMNTWFPQKNALWMAENCTGTLHNLYTLRGAEVRDGNKWSHYLMESLSRYGDKAQVVFQAHNWPHWGNAYIKEYITNTALIYQFIHDQSLLYLNRGMTENEIAHAIHLPPALEKVWYTRQYYGTVPHNAKAVYEKYMGWYDANPVNLNALPPAVSAKKYAEYLGDPQAVLEKARQDFAKGEYQWVAEITNQLVFADPKNQEARNLCADALEQLAYQAESGTWRNVYLSGAKELREGSKFDPSRTPPPSPDIRRKMDSSMMLDDLGIMLDTDKAHDLNFDVNLYLTDTGEKYLLRVRSGVLLYQKGEETKNPDAVWRMPKDGLFTILSKDKEKQAKLIRQEGDKTLLSRFSDAITVTKAFFNFIEP